MKFLVAALIIWVVATCVEAIPRPVARRNHPFGLTIPPCGKRVLNLVYNLVGQDDFGVCSKAMALSEALAGFRSECSQDDLILSARCVQVTCDNIGLDPLKMDLDPIDLDILNASVLSTFPAGTNLLNPRLDMLHTGYMRTDPNSMGTDDTPNTPFERFVVPILISVGAVLGLGLFFWGFLWVVYFDYCRKFPCLVPVFAFFKTAPSPELICQIPCNIIRRYAERDRSELAAEAELSNAFAARDFATNPISPRPGSGAVVGNVITDVAVEDKATSAKATIDKKQAYSKFQAVVEDTEDD